MRHTIVLEGPPLCGKSTQAKKLEEKLGYHIVDSGRILGRYSGLTDIVSTGNLVPDDEVIGAISKYLSGELPKRLVFNGFPRSVEQGKWLQGIMEHQHYHVSVVMLYAPEQNLLSRMKNKEDEERTKNRLNQYKEYGPGVRRFLCTSSFWRVYQIDAKYRETYVSKEIERLVVNQLANLIKNKPIVRVLA